MSVFSMIFGIRKKKVKRYAVPARKIGVIKVAIQAGFDLQIIGATAIMTKEVFV